MVQAQGSLRQPPQIIQDDLPSNSNSMYTQAVKSSDLQLSDSSFIQKKNKKLSDSSVYFPKDGPPMSLDAN
ncbi:hypothetical protein MTR_2g049620 [Medicago truncatula]|uniref:Uncharacterized protein n=1 Tax=Medicago truncatula TaxID=3880 RepID=Q2HRQ2_MEDTR|nr:hypothetical protein MtrDRAFT_AC158464g5v2 [Medicago truncatula]AES65830.1 hypothetical protein MTR_2g049620 [Medicago truncatula]